MRSHPDWKAYGALAAVCFFWGTTYLGIRMALESFPPLVLITVRFLISGSALLAAGLLRGAHIPRRRELLFTSLNGLLILGVGNGCLVYSETWIPSGLAALFLTTSPFWLVGMEALAPNGERLHLPTVAGLLIGLAGTALLIYPAGGVGRVDANVWRGFLVLQLGCFSWNLGSIAQRAQTTRAHPVISGALQQLATGLVYLPPALLIPEPPVRWSFTGTAALVYLIVFGSIVGYSSYIYALDKLPVAVVSIYNYVNPVVAVALGWLFYREPVGVKEIAAMLIIFSGVAVVKRFSHRAPGGSVFLENLGPEHAAERGQDGEDHKQEQH